MEANEMILDEVEVVEDVVETTTDKISGSGLKIAAGVGVGMIAGVLIYKYVAVPVIAKMKARKETTVVENDAAIIEADEFEDVDDLDDM